MDTATSTLPKGQMIKSLEHEDSPETKTLSDQKNHAKAIAKGAIHTKQATTQDYLSDGIGSMSCGSRDKAGKWQKWTNFPDKGEMSVLIDDEGNWEFSVEFPPHNMPLPCDVAVGIGLKSAIGQVILFTAHGRVPNEGWLYSKQGHAPIVKDLWKDVVKGHKFHAQWAMQQVPPSPPPSSGSSGGSSGSDLGSEIITGITTVLGVLAAIF